MTPRDLPVPSPLDSSDPPWRVLCARDPTTWLEELPARGLAIVGARRPQSRSLRLVGNTVEALKASGLTIISGFARGIDECAHEAALGAGLRTLAILGSGIDLDYPKGSHRLKERILEQDGMILSPFADGTPPLAHQFHERNRLIAHFSSAVWVVEGAAVSGTLNTAHWASHLNRDLYATPAFPGDPFYSGNEKLLSHSEPLRHPLAHPFYGPRSLLGTWPGLLHQQGELFPLPPEHPLERLVLELESEFGECRLPLLHERCKPRSWAEFNGILEQAIRNGRVRLTPSGTVQLQRVPKS